MKKTEEIIPFESYCVVENDLWISARNFNALIKMNLMTGKSEVVGTFPEENALKKRLHYGESIVVGNRIYFVPLESNRMHSYNLVTGEFEKCNLHKEGPVGAAKAVYFENHIYMFSTRTTTILDYDILKDDYTEYCDGEFYKEGYHHGVAKYQDVVFLMMIRKNILRSFDLKKQQVRDFRIGNESSYYQIAGQDGKRIYIFEEPNKTLLCWNIETEHIEKKWLIEENISLNAWQIGNYVVGNDWDGKGSTILNLQDMSCEKFFMGKTSKKNSLYEILGAFYWNNDLLIEKEDGRIYSFGKRKLYSQVTLVSSCIEHLWGDLKKEDIGLVKEESHFSLRDFIRLF